MKNNLTIRKSYWLIFLINFIIIQNVFSQHNLVNVSQPTGTASVVIPVASVSNGALSASVALYYNSSGLRVKDVEGLTGMGWNLQAGGLVTREVRGLPDDVKHDNSPSDRLGWLYNSNASVINNFTVANTNDGTYSKEASDLNYMNTNIAANSDTEPDLFSVSAPGLSFQFVFESGAAVIRTIPYQDVKVVPNRPNSTTGEIASFTVVNDKGVQYAFTQATKSTLRTRNFYTQGFTTHTIPESSIVYNKTRFDLYKQGVDYVNSWYLTSITDPNGNVIKFNYRYDNDRVSETPINLTVGGTSTLLYYEDLRASRCLLEGITSNDQKIGFVYNTNSSTNQAILNAITTNSATFQLNYSAVTASFSNNYNRFFLRDVTTDQCDVPFKYHFDYKGEYFSSAGSYATPLPDSSSNDFDYWGYYNHGGLNSDPRGANPAYTDAGLLNKISFYDGGTTTLEYESNTYYNTSTFYASGSRIKTITDYDGINTANNIVRNFSYLDPATGLTSGLMGSFPGFYFHRAFNNAVTQDAIVSSVIDMNEDDHSIYYTTVKVSQTGAGSIVYQYQEPGTMYDTSGPFSWVPTKNVTARTSSSQTLGLAQSDSNYPFAPNPDISFERGLLTKETAYDEGGSKVSETTYTYAATGQPVKINALRKDQNNYAVSYARYQIFTATSELISTVSKKIFTPGSSVNSQNSLTEYQYESTKHKLPTSIRTTNSDGSVQVVSNKYSRDYQFNDTSSPFMYFQQHNMNLPVEQYQTVNPMGYLGTAVVKAKLFDYYNGAIGLPYKILEINSPNGVYGFQISSNASDGYGHEQMFYDPHYTVSSYNTYDANGFPVTVSDTKNHGKTIIYDSYTHAPVAIFNKAYLTQVAFSNFEVLPPYNIPSRVGGRSFTKTSYTYAEDRASGNNKSLALEANAPLTISSASALYGGPTEIFSCWLKASSAGAITITLASTHSADQVIKQLTFAANPGVWKYYQVKIPLSSPMLGYTFTADVRSNVAVNIDDMLMYPESATVSTVTYDAITGYKLAQTNTNGITEYYTNDGAGRVRLVADKDKNIVLRNTYRMIDATANFTEPTFVVGPVGTETTLYTASNLLFRNINTYNTCQFLNLLFTWTFGDGTTATSSTPEITHAYTTAGNYNVVCKVSATGFTDKTYSASVTITTAPPPVATPPSPVTIYTSNNVSTASIKRVDFYQNGAIVQSFNAADLSSASVPPGFYTIIVTIDEPTPTHNFGSFHAYSQVSSTVTANYCADYSKTDRYTFDMDMRTALWLHLDLDAGPATCTVNNNVQ